MKWENKLRRKVNDFATYFNNYMQTKEKISSNVIAEAKNENDKQIENQNSKIDEDKIHHILHATK